jgi:tetratricopeptide (TPR) repeat protein
VSLSHFSGGRYLGGVSDLLTLVPSQSPVTAGLALLEEGRLGQARHHFWLDAEAALAAGDAERLATAALGLGGLWVHEHRLTLERARVDGVQRKALDSLDPSSSLARRLRIRLAAEETYATGDTRPILAELEQARERSEPLALAEALSLAHHCLLGPHHRELRLRLADELIAISPSTGRSVDGLMGIAWRTVDLLLAGDRRAGRSLGELRDHLAIERCDCLAYLVAALDVMLAMRAGRLGEAEELAGRCYELGLDVGDADALGWYGAQLVAIRWMQGRGEDVLPLLGDLVHSPTVAEPCTGFVAAQAALAAATGDLDTARSALASLRSGGLGNVPPSSIWSATMLGACEAAFALGDAETAAEAYDLLVPYADLPVMASLAVACFGSAHRPLGLAALAVGDLERAIEHLEAAVAADLAVGNLPCHAIDRATLADALDLRRGAGDAERASELRRGAIDDALRFGMTSRAEQWGRTQPVGDSASIVLQRDGRVWRVRQGDHAALVPHTIGMCYLAEMIRHPDVEIAAVALSSGYAGPCPSISDQPVLDARAKAEYRRRIEELQEEVDEAETCADLERAARARAELDRFVDELTRSMGLAGRSRSFADDAERARIAVRKAIKRALATISEADPDLGREIGSRVVTGARCVYRAPVMT